MSYVKFAQTYDQLMDKTLYTQWANFVRKHIEPHTNILELACGSGDLAAILENEYNYTASDLSEDMLILAQDRVKKTILFQCDMQNFDLDVNFDAIICFADSICYLPDEKAVVNTFKQVYQHLKEEGIFLFDVHSIYQINEGYADFNYHFVDDNTLFVWDSFVEENNTVYHEISCVNRLENGLYERYDETHCQRTYSLESYKHYLALAGFQNIEVTTDFGQAAVDETTTRWFFKASK